jgi:hypothetical protein
MAIAKRVSQVDLFELENLVLIALYDHYTTSQEPYIGADQISNLVGCGGVNAITDLLDELESNNLVKREIQERLQSDTIAAITGTGRIRTTNFRLTRDGAQHISAMPEEKFSLLAAKLTLSKSISANANTINEWEPLQIDREASEFREAVAVAEKAIDRIAADNGYASTQADERDGIVATMRGTISALKSGWISRDTIVAGLLRPLRFLTEKFSGSAIGEAGKKALDALLSYFGWA